LDAGNSSDEDNDSNLRQLKIENIENNNCEQMEENGLREILNQLPPSALYSAISVRIPQRVEFLKTKKCTKAYAEKFVDGLRLYYHALNPLSLKGIAEKWNITWAKARRIFQLSELVANVQYTSEEVLICKIKERANQFFASEISSNPNKFKEIVEEVRSFLDEIAFKQAHAELVAPRNPYKNSLFAQILRDYMSDQK
ncbi:MAG: hypothetical protein AAF349_26490, partial [Cyanobacteria bacterium P01_A01_bin.68]